MEYATRRTWTNFTGACRFCGESFRVSQEAIEDTRRDAPDGATDEELAGSLDICLECVDKPEPGEKPELDDLVQSAIDAFWATVAKSTRASSGDLAPGADDAFASEARSIVREWIRVNRAQLDK